MNEQQFTDLLKKLKIPTNNRSYGDIFDLLDAKLSEYLDRQDAESQELIDEIQDALDYAEIKKNEAGSGIALKKEESVSKDTLDMDELRDASEKAHKEQERVKSANEGAVNAGTANAGAVNSGTASANATAGASAAPQSVNQAGKLWFFSLTGADNINTMFYQALDDLKYGEFNHAKSILEAILQVEPSNASAYLGKAMAELQFKELRDMGIAYDKDVFADINIRRAYDHGNAMQKKYLDDVKAELENGKKYKNADKLAMNNTSQIDLSEARKQFLELGSYRDSAQRAKQCAERILELKYERAVNERKKASDAAGFRKAAELFGRVSGYKDADKQAQECEEIAKEKGAAEAEWKRTEGIRKGYDEAKKAFEDMAAYYKSSLDNAINFGRTLPDDLDIAVLEGRLKDWKDYLARNSELKTILAADMDIVTAEGALDEVRKLYRQCKKDANAKKSEKFTDSLLICIMVAAMLLCGLAGDITQWASWWVTFLPVHSGEELYVLDGRSPYLVSVSNIKRLEIRSWENLQTIILPFSELEEVELAGGDYSDLELPDTVKKLVLSGISGVNIPEGVEELTISNSPNLTSLVLPEGIEKITIDNLDALENLIIPKSAEQVSIKNCELIEDVEY